MQSYFSLLIEYQIQIVTANSAIMTCFNFIYILLYFFYISFYIFVNFILPLAIQTEICK